MWSIHEYNAVFSLLELPQSTASFFGLERKKKCKTFIKNKFKTHFKSHIMALFKYTRIIFWFHKFEANLPITWPNQISFKWKHKLVLQCSSILNGVLNWRVKYATTFQILPYCFCSFKITTKQNFTITTYSISYLVGHKRTTSQFLDTPHWLEVHFWLLFPQGKLVAVAEKNQISQNTAKHLVYTWIII